MRSKELGVRSFVLAVFVLVFSGVSFASNLIDAKSMNVRTVDELNMSGIMPNYKGTGSFTESETPDFNLPRMKSMNPDFSTYPEEHGIIWQKYVDVSHSGNGIEITRLYVILGRQGLAKKWLTWNIQNPANGEIDILLSEVYDFNTLQKITEVTPKDDTDNDAKVIDFIGLPDNFILAVAWKEILPQQLSVEGLCWFQEELRVWESVVDVHLPQELSYKTFPAPLSPETEFINGEHSYAWRKINIDPYVPNELARFQRQGVIFGARKGRAALAGFMKELEGVNVSAPAEAGATPQRITSWLMKRPEIEFAEGTARKIPSLSSPLTKREKILLARSWLVSKKVNALLAWQLPFEPDEETPLCMDMFSSPVLECPGAGNFEFHDMKAPGLLTGSKIFSYNSDAGRLVSRRIPASKSTENKLSATMNFTLSDKGLLSGNVRVVLRGAWRSFVLGDDEPTREKLNAAVLSLFPDLKNFSDVAFKVNKNLPEISFKIDNKPGVAGTGKGILISPPFFEPVAMRRLGSYDPPVEILFPFVVDQNITIAYPNNVKEALVSGRSAKNPDKINYSHNYFNKRKSLNADARFEINIQSVNSGNMALLRRCLDQWRAFSARQIPLR
ncbi:MAG: hypothetical protein IJU31_00255 [Synergistaceae bacterium]|nr:hypothetical protein [Synergistaceae bacterium]